VLGEQRIVPVGLKVLRQGDARPPESHCLTFALCAATDRFGEVLIPEPVRVSEAKERSVGVEREIALPKR
jgi:hypothetical protein